MSKVMVEFIERFKAIEKAHEERCKRFPLYRGCRVVFDWPKSEKEMSPEELEYLYDGPSLGGLHD